MKTQLKTEVSGVAIELSLIEATKFLEDPKHVQQEVRDILKTRGFEFPNDPQWADEKKPETRPCPHCGRHFKVLGIHLARGCKHDPSREQKS